MNKPLQTLVLSLAAVSCWSFSKPCSAMEPEVQWVFSAGGKKHDKTRAVGVDSGGNALLAGEVTGPLEIGGREFPGAGEMDYFVAKVDPMGKLLWVNVGGGTKTDRCYAVAADKEGNVYAGGHFASPDAEFGGKRVSFAGEYDFFLVKYNAAGELQWVRTGGGAGYDYIHGIAVDSVGNVVVTGAVAGAAKIGDVLIENGPGGHLFCAKYDSAGTLLWARATAGKAAGSGHGVAVDGAGNIYVGGANSGVGEFGGKKLETVSGQDSLVAKLSPNGEVLWMAQNHGVPGCLVHEVTCDASGRVWIAGMFRGSADFAGRSFQSGGEKDNDAFIAHYSASGEFKWVRVGQGKGTDYGLGIATDGEGNSFWCGTFAETSEVAGKSLTTRGSYDIHLSSLDAAGNVRWITQMGGPASDNAYTLAYHSSGVLFMGGQHSKAAVFGSKEVTDQGGGDFYAAKIRVR
jgi:hypothetical protein